MRTRARYLLAATLLTLPLAGGCHKQKYKAETTAPAAAGQALIVLSIDKTGNGEISLDFEHLAPPQSIDPALQAYVVWAVSDGKDPYKLGILDYSEKKRGGSLRATFSDDKMKIIMTVEKDGGVAGPVGARVLEQAVVAPKR